MTAEARRVFVLSAGQQNTLVTAQNEHVKGQRKTLQELHRVGFVGGAGGWVRVHGGFKAPLTMAGLSARMLLLDDLRKSVQTQRDWRLAYWPHLKRHRSFAGGWAPSREISPGRWQAQLGTYRATIRSGNTPQAFADILPPKDIQG